jgi:hypothetical protein
MSKIIEKLDQVIGNPDLVDQAVKRIEQRRKDKGVTNPLNPLLIHVHEFLNAYRDSDYQQEADVIGGLYYIYSETEDPRQKQYIGSLFLESLNALILEEPFSVDQNLTNFRQLAQALFTVPR